MENYLGRVVLLVNQTSELQNFLKKEEKEKMCSWKLIIVPFD